MIDLNAVNARRESFYDATRQRISEYVSPDGEGRIPQFAPPYREPVWILPALYTGAAADIELANRMAGRYHTDSEGKGKRYNIFQSNAFAHCLHRFESLLSPAAREVMVWHTKQLFKTYMGAAQPDYKFHGCNDNMPMMATKGLILGGEALDNAAAVRHGRWNLNQFRRLLSRSAWASEFNSSTYTAVTLSAVAKIAAYACDAETRELARDIEHRLWAEVLLHYHPGTRHQGGPQCRAYSIDLAGHNHALQLMLWLLFGPEVTGRDLFTSYFHPDGTEVIHFEGHYFQSVAEYCEMLDTEFHLPEELSRLITERDYPARLRGRTECMFRFDGFAADYHTESYMEKEFSLGSVNGPLATGEQTTGLYVTYQRRPEVKTFRDASTVFLKYLTSSEPYGATERSADGQFEGERFTPCRGWSYALQKDNTGLLLCVPNLKNAPFIADTLKLAVVFPAHYGRITRSLIGNGEVMPGAVGSSSEVAPVSVEAGEVYLHIQPLPATSLPRKTAVRWARHGNYELLELVNYEGEPREFHREELKTVLNGAVMTVAAKKNWPSLEEFHRFHSAALVTDYFFGNHRFVVFQREDVEFEVVMTTDPFGIQTESVDGRQVPRPIFESNQLDVAGLPFMSGPVPRYIPLFPWGDCLEAHTFPDQPWLIGSRGLPEEPNYSRHADNLKR